MNERADRPTERFSNRVANYVKFRPHYPAGVLECLVRRCGLDARSIIADIGSGTGILSELFLRNGNPVFGVEPNREMREAGERLLREYPRFTSVVGSAESTTLPAAAVDFVTAGQAFHWFDRDAARAEFQRIVKPNGWVVLVWNERDEVTTPFARAYESLLNTFGTDYTAVTHRNIEPSMLAQFFSTDFGVESMPNAQHFDYAALEGRLLSSSFVPAPAEPGYEEMLAELRRVFDRYAVDGGVAFEYETRVYFGRLE